MAATLKTGECYYRDEQGLWLAESFADKNGKVTTQSKLITPASELPDAASPEEVQA